MSEALVILCTCPDEATAAALGAGLVEKRLAACVNVLPAIRSIYRWQGAVNNEAETLMVIKTLQDRYPELEAWLVENHPYDVPEVVALAAHRVVSGYLGWIEESVRT